MKRASSRLAGQLGPLTRQWVGWTIFGIIAYIFGMYFTAGVMSASFESGLFSAVDATSYALITRLVLYGAIVALMILIPVWLGQRLSRKDMGVDRVMEWRDIGIGIAGGVLYLLLAMAALTLAKLIPGVDLTQVQNLDVGQVYGVAQVMVFVVLVIVTPFMEELLFRGIFYGGLRKRHLSAWASALIVSVLFGVAHGQLNVGIDVFCLSLVACYARELTGSIWAGVVLHMIKNGIAFALLFTVA